MVRGLGVTVNKYENRIKKQIKHNRFLAALFFVPIRIRRFIWKIHKDYLESKFMFSIGSMEYGTVAIRAPRFGDIFEFDIRSDILKRIVVYGEYEFEHLEIIEKYIQPDKDMLDIGANIGLYTVFFARRIAKDKHVLAIEPAPNALRLLERNLQRNGVANSAILFNGVASNVAGNCTVKVIPGKEEYSTLGRNINQAQVHNRSAIEIEVPGETIDRLVQQFELIPGFIKIDTEGAEYLVLSGAEKTLKKYHPVILAELVDKYLANFGHSASRVVNFLNSCGYKVVDIATDETPLFPFEGEILAIVQ